MSLKRKITGGFCPKCGCESLYYEEPEKRGLEVDHVLVWEFECSDCKAVGTEVYKISIQEVSVDTDEGLDDLYLADEEVELKTPKKG
jgi:hypothetical protein